MAGHGENRVATTRIDNEFSLSTSAAHPLRKGEGGGEADPLEELTKSAALCEWAHEGDDCCDRMHMSQIFKSD